MAYKSLTTDEQARFDPMITGFNPTDMYAADHIRRVLQTFPGVFTGIGEFTIHKEFVSAKFPAKSQAFRTRHSIAYSISLPKLVCWSYSTMMSTSLSQGRCEDESEPAYLNQ